MTQAVRLRHNRCPSVTGEFAQPCPGHMEYVGEYDGRSSLGRQFAWYECNTCDRIALIERLLTDTSMTDH